MSIRVSLIVTTETNSWHSRRQDFFDSIAAQTFAHDAFEFIMVDAHARPDTAAAFGELRARHPGLSASLLPYAVPARAVCSNLAAARAQGELLIFLADDFDPSPGLVAAHAAFHALNPDPRAVGIGPGLFPSSERLALFARWAEDSGHVFGLPLRRTLAFWPRTFFYGANTSIKKSMFTALGGFDERFPRDAWDDYEFGLRWAAAGGYSQFLAAATAAHRHAVTLEERLGALEFAGEGAVLLERLHPDTDRSWRAMLERGAHCALPRPAPDAPDTTWIAYYSEQLDAAFRRGYQRAQGRG